MGTSNQIKFAKGFNQNLWNEMRRAGLEVGRLLFTMSIFPKANKNETIFDVLIYPYLESTNYSDVSLKKVRDKSDSVFIHYSQ